MGEFMSRRWSAVFILGMFLALPLGTVRADESGAPPANDREASHWKQGEGRGHKEFDLTDDQKAKIKSVKEAQEKVLKPLWRKQRDLSIKLRDQLEDKAGDPAIERTLSDMRANREAMETESKRFRSQRDAIFTPTQRARMMIKHQNKREHRGHWGHEKMDRRDGDWKKDD